VAELHGKGIRVVREFDELLGLGIDAVWLPLPIDLHLPFTERALAAGKAVLCEKPAAGAVDDVDRMIAARDASGLPVVIGFQDIYQPAVATVKDRLLAGEFGKALGARVIGCWPRSERYFGRNDWAGRMRREGRWVMDSPASNALAHFLHLALFMLGPTRQETAHATSVAAELYRANPIENYDTCSMHFTIGDGLPLYVAYTHACASTIDPIVTIDTEQAQISYIAGQHIKVRKSTGAVETLPLSANPHKHMLKAFAAWVGGEVDSVIGSTLEMARDHVVAVNAASEAAPVVDVPHAHIDVMRAADRTLLRAIREILPAMKSCIADRCTLNQTGLAPWSSPPQSKLINGYTHFSGPRGARPRPQVVAKTFVSNDTSPALDSLISAKEG
jgi:predicted dehydrogenase